MRKKRSWQDFLFSITILAVAATIGISTYSFNSDQTKTIISRQHLKGPSESLFEGIYVDRAQKLQAEPEITRDRQIERSIDVVEEDSSSAMDFWQKLEEYPVLISNDVRVPDQPGVTKRVKIVKTDFEYPLIRVVETYEKPHPAKADRRIAMVADHVLVSLRPGYTQRDLEVVTEKYGVKIRKKVEGRLQTYLVSFEYRDTESLDRIVEDFRREGESFMVVQPDFIQNL